MQEQERVPGIASETAVLVRVILPGQAGEQDPLLELQRLATTAGANIEGHMIQRRVRPSSRTFLGKGKVEELIQLVAYCDADVVIFDNDLTPAQTRNLERAVNTKVLDRTELILDIFASNAQTHESRLSVELAQLEYSLPRLKHMWTHLSRMKMGIGMRGPGEKQLEFDRRLVEKRIHELRNELKKIERRKERQVAARDNHMTVSLVGYTNAGKSTLMNVLTGSNLLAEDKLFATLDTRTRRWQLPHWGPILLSDTVGFIRNLPHRLITSFKATLEEARQTNLLLHVADATNPEVLDQIRAVTSVLKEIGIDEKDTLLTLNKIDMLDSPAPLDMILNNYPHAIPISASTNLGLEQLALAVSDSLSRTFHDVNIEMDVSNGKLMAYLAAHGEVLSQRYHENRVLIHCRIPQKYLGRIDDPDVLIEDHSLLPTNATKPATTETESSRPTVDDTL